MIKDKCFRIMSLLPIAVTVGVMTFITAWVCQYMGWTIWLAFLSWALYFMHGATAKDGVAALGSFVFGIVLAQLAIHYINWLMNILPDSSLSQYVVPSSVFIVAAVITFVMRFNRAWAGFIPAVYIGTVFRFAYNDLAKANPNISSLVTDLLFPIIFGLFIGWCTVSLLLLLDNMGISEWRKRWVIDTK